jgi:hypothetical protein
MNLDAKVMFYFNTGGVTPGMTMTIPGAGSDYAMAYLDSKNEPFDGSNLHVAFAA